DFAAGNDVRHVAHLLFRRAEVGDVHRCHLRVDERRHRDAAECRAAELFGEYDRAESVELAAAVLRRITDADEAELAHAAQNLRRNKTLLLPRMRERLDLGLDETPDLAAQQLVLLAEIGGEEPLGRQRRRGRRVHGFSRACHEQVPRRVRARTISRARYRGAWAPSRRWCRERCFPRARGASPARWSPPPPRASRRDRWRRRSRRAARPCRRAGEGDRPAPWNFCTRSRPAGGGLLQAPGRSPRIAAIRCPARLS